MMELEHEIIPLFKSYYALCRFPLKLMNYIKYVENCRKLFLKMVRMILEWVKFAKHSRYRETFIYWLVNNDFFVPLIINQGRLAERYVYTYAEMRVNK